MSSAYERAVAFTAGLLDLRVQPPFIFNVGRTTVNVSTLPELVTSVSLEDAGEGLKTMRCNLSLPGRRGTLRTSVYISAGPRSSHDHDYARFPEGTHYLYVHDADGRKALQIPMHQVVVADEAIVLSVEVNFPKDGPEVEERLRLWLRSQGFRFEGDRVVLGTAADFKSLLLNLLTLGLLKQHVRGHFVIPEVVEELPPRGMDAAPEEVSVVFRDYTDQRGFEINAVNSGRLPPTQVRFQVEVGAKTVTMWASRFSPTAKAVTTCEGAYDNMAELRDAMGLKAGDRLRLIPLGVRHYRLEKAESDSIYPIGIFMRLGQTKAADGRTVNGFETMELYRTDAQGRGHTWFSTDSLSSGMGQDRVRQFKEALNSGSTVVVYFMVSISGGGTNQLEYTAHLKDLYSNPDPNTPCPEEGGVPAFRNAGRIWLKLSNLQKQKLDPSDFVIDGPGSNLAQQVAKGMFQFGYIRRSPRTSGGGTGHASLAEAEVVDKLCTYLKDSGFRFSREMVINYWISLKTKPFVILAGLSGSGKSKLPLLVAKALGAQFCRIAVSPGWTEDSDLLGYRNPLDESGAFQVTDFTAFLMRAHKDQENRIWFVCLDEMNLARVEHYFAKFLSAMEGLEASDRIIQLHSGSDPGVPQSVPIPRSFLFTGTVNMDETTHTFSHKVLDRANLVEFDVKPEELLEDLPPLTDPGGSLNLSYTDFQRYCAAGGDSRFRPDLVEIARILQPVRAHFGFRVREEIERFIANGAGLLEPEDLFDLQIHQKILPKIRGTGTALASALQQLHDLAVERGWSRSADKLNEMRQRLSDDGISHFYR